VNDLTKNILVFVVIIVVLLSVVQGLSGMSTGQPQVVQYSEFLDQVRSGQVNRVEIDGARIRFGSGQALTHYTTDTDAVRSFCKQCGSTLFYSGPRWPDEWHVALANVEGKLDREPGAHVYVDHKAAWWTIEDALPRLGGESGVEPKS